MRVLILGGTDEARRLAAALADRPGLSVVSSLAGRVKHPTLPVGEVTIGGFGGADGLAAYLAEHAVDLVVDATHPFASRISANAAAATGRTGTRLVTLRRPGWQEQPGDRWTRVPDIEAAAAVVRHGRHRSVFLTTGRRDLAPFADDTERRYLIRAVDAPTVALPLLSTVILDRGPYTLERELALLEEHAIDVIITKDSGGELTRAKLDAARQRRVPVMMVDRPAQHGPVAATVEEAVTLMALDPQLR